MKQTLPNISKIETLKDLETTLKIKKIGLGLTAIMAFLEVIIEVFIDKY